MFFASNFGEKNSGYTRVPTVPMDRLPLTDIISRRVILPDFPDFLIKIMTSCDLSRSVEKCVGGGLGVWFILMVPFCISQIVERGS